MLFGLLAPRPLAGQLVMVTGASRGVGAALAVALAAEGCELCLCARDADALTQVQADCATAAAGARGPHPRCITIVADVSKTVDCGRLVAQCRNVFGRVPDVLINNAACTGNSGQFAQMPAQDITEMLACNIGAPILLARHLLPEMQERGSGTIVNISSVCGFTALPGAAAYCATKAALNSFTVALRAELKGTGVRVLSICPTCITEGGAYDRHMKECASNGMLRNSLAWLYEVPLEGVVGGVLAQLRWGAPYALVPLTLLPVRLLGLLQQLAPDWVTPWLPSTRAMFFDPLGKGADSAALSSKGAASKAAAARKEE